MRHLDLFSGIGGFALAARWAGLETVAFCECDPFCQQVLRKHWPTTTIHDDVRNVDGRDYRGIELITGGYPCQPFSIAGERRGTSDDRHLWPEMRRIISDARPTWVVAENVLGHVSMGLDEVLHDLEAEGYAARAVVIPACAADAPHQRDRLWILAYATGEGPHAGAQAGVYSGEKGARARNGEPKRRVAWGAEPDVARVVDGIPTGMDRARIKALGNAIVPQVAYELLRTMVSYNAEITGRASGPG